MKLLCRINTTPRLPAIFIANFVPCDLAKAQYLGYVPSGTISTSGAVRPSLGCHICPCFPLNIYPQNLNSHPLFVPNGYFFKCLPLWTDTIHFWQQILLNKIGWSTRLETSRHKCNCQARSSTKAANRLWSRRRLLSSSQFRRKTYQRNDPSFSAARWEKWPLRLRERSEAVTTRKDCQQRKKATKRNIQSLPKSFCKHLLILCVYTFHHNSIKEKLNKDDEVEKVWSTDQRFVIASYRKGINIEHRLSSCQVEASALCLCVKFVCTGGSI